MMGFHGSINPFRGLRPFDLDESFLFFGRDGQSDELLRKLGRTRFVAIIGSSGSGKSSLLRAGLLPGLLGGFLAPAGANWRIAIFRPGSNPIRNLAEALKNADGSASQIQESSEFQTDFIEATLRNGSLGLVEYVRQSKMAQHENLLVVADQFEELFRFLISSGSDEMEDEAAAFVKLLLRASEQEAFPIYVAITMRSDFIGDCAQFWGLPEAINAGQYLIPRLERDECREAIAGPVAVGGGSITEPLVNLILNDMGNDPNRLPVFQHALMRTWDRWKSRKDNEAPIDISDYQAIGEMANALSFHADETYEELNYKKKEIAEKLFKYLTEKGQDNREYRRPATLSQICAVVEAPESEVVAVIENFRRSGRSFLMPPEAIKLTSESLIDITHESLIRGWRRLESWVEEEAQSARTYRRLADAATLFGQGQEALMTGPALQITLDWREQQKPNRVWAERYHPGFETAMTFLDESRAAHDAQMAEKQRQVQASARRLRWFVLALIVILLFAIAAALYANSLRLVSSRQRAIAEQSNEEAQRLAVQAEEQRKRADEKAREAEKQRLRAEQLLTTLSSANAELQRVSARLKKANDELNRRYKMELINFDKAKPDTK